MTAPAVVVNYSVILTRKNNDILRSILHKEDTISSDGVAEFAVVHGYRVGFRHFVAPGKIKIGVPPISDFNILFL